MPTTKIRNQSLGHPDPTKALDTAARWTSLVVSLDPKYVTDVLATAGVALGAGKTSGTFDTDGMDTFVVDVHGSLGAGSLQMQALNDPESADWVDFGAALATGMNTVTGFRRRIRFVYTHSGGSVTAVNVLALRSNQGATGTSFSLAAGSALVGKFAIDQTTPGTTNAIVAKAVAAAAVSYRAGVVAADVVAVPGTVTCTKLTGVGSMTAGTYAIVVVAGNTYGRTTGKNGNVTVTTETTNLGVRAAFAQVAGATFYDIYASVASAGAALFVGRITETQRASGIILTAVNTTGAGGTPGAVDIYAIGTGLAANAGQVAQNTAFTPESLTPIDPSGAQFLDVNVSFSRSGDSVAGALTLLPFYAMSNSHYAAGDPITLTFGGQVSTYYPNRQTFRLPCRGRQTVLVVANIAGTGASVDLETVAN